MSGAFSHVNSDPLSIQTTTPAVTLQLKLAVDPSVVLTAVGVLINSGVTHTKKETIFECALTRK